MSVALKTTLGMGWPSVTVTVCNVLGSTSKPAEESPPPPLPLPLPSPLMKLPS
jgi:hypothetical protein